MKRMGMRPLERLSVLPEPDLEFRYGQKLHAPHDGLALFGPFDADAGTHPKSIAIGAIGTPEGLDALRRWLTAINGPLISKESESHPRLWPPFPGFSAAFACTLPAAPTVVHRIDRQKLLLASTQNDAHKRTYDV